MAYYVYNWEGQVDAENERKKQEELANDSDTVFLLKSVSDIYDKIDDLKKDNKKLKKKVLNIDTQIEKIKLYQTKQKKYIHKICKKVNIDIEED